MGHLQDVMLRSDTIKLSKDHWEVDGIFAFCYKVGNCSYWRLNLQLFKVRNYVLRLHFHVSGVLQVMFESGYLTLFGKEFGDRKCEARQAAQKALVLSALENFKEFDKIFPALVAGLPIHVFKSAYSAREVSLSEQQQQGNRKKDI